MNFADTAMSSVTDNDDKNRHRTVCLSCYILQKNVKTFEVKDF